ncbi:cupredoxin domain-containing protein [Halostella litorea]|uniref:cupredoxin domain-containing protein n=1 Tax=Halostella litorea TaxID=2528831 RepID=UPI0010920E9B|nr:plastocyanin/azurin family copper-binding protein [Halostella litorea]
MTRNDPTSTSGASRRDLLRYAAATGAVAGIGGVATAQDGTETGDGQDGTESGDGNGTAGGQDGDVHPAFGFPALSDDVEPPVEPDHVVEARTEPREDRPNPEFFFTPTGLFVEPGDTVRFSMVSPSHNAMAYHPGFGRTRRVPEGVPPISSPLFAEGAYWLYTFDEPGVYDLYCGPHEFLGMAMRVVAGEASGPGAEPVPEPAFTAGVEGPEPGAGNAADGNATAGNDTAAPGTTGNVTAGDAAGNATAGNATTGNATADGATGGSQADLTPPTGLAASVLRADALAPENVIDAGTVAWDDLPAEVKEFPSGGG